MTAAQAPPHGLRRGFVRCLCCGIRGRLYRGLSRRRRRVRATGSRRCGMWRLSRRRWLGRQHDRRRRKARWYRQGQGGHQHGRRWARRARGYCRRCWRLDCGGNGSRHRSRCRWRGSRGRKWRWRSRCCSRGCWRGWRRRGRSRSRNGNRRSYWRCRDGCRRNGRNGNRLRRYDGLRHWRLLESRCCGARRRRGRWRCDSRTCCGRRGTRMRNARIDFRKRHRIGFDLVPGGRHGDRSCWRRGRREGRLGNFGVCGHLRQRCLRRSGCSCAHSGIRGM